MATLVGAGLLNVWALAAGVVAEVPDLQLAEASKTSTAVGPITLVAHRTDLTLRWCRARGKTGR